LQRELLGSKYCYERSEIVQTTAKACGVKTSRLTNDLWRKTFWQSNMQRSFAET